MPFSFLGNFSTLAATGDMEKAAQNDVTADLIIGSTSITITVLGNMDDLAAPVSKFGIDLLKDAAGLSAPVMVAPDVFGPSGNKEENRE